MILKDKVVIIVGVGPGMGKAMALIAAREGAKVAIGARNRSFLDAVVAEIVSEGGEALALSTDVTDRAQCDALVAATVERWGRVDGLVNSAYAPGENGSFDDANVESWAHTIDVACLGAARMAQAVLPHMAAQGGGAIVNVATMQAQKPLPGGSLSYAIAKGALVTTSRQLAAEMGKHNIRVNATRMGWLWGEPVQNRAEIYGRGAGHDGGRSEGGRRQGYPARRDPARGGVRQVGADADLRLYEDGHRRSARREWRGVDGSLICAGVTRSLAGWQ